MRSTAARPKDPRPVDREAPKKTRRLGAALVLLVTIGLVPAAATPSQAHTSTYCGHGTSGLTTETRYVGSVYSGYPYVHIHRYEHYYWTYKKVGDHYYYYWDYLHTQDRICSVH